MKGKKIVVATTSGIKVCGKTSELIFVARAILETIGKSQGLEFSISVKKDQMVFKLYKESQCNTETKE